MWQGLVVSSRHVFGDLSEWLEVAPNDGVDEHARVLHGVPRRNIDHVGLDHNGPVAVTRGWRRAVEGGDRLVVSQAVVPADDAEADDVALVVEDLEALGAPAGGEAGDDVDLAEGAHVAVSDDDVAALDEVLVGLGVVEAPHDWPHGGDGGVDLLDHGGAALLGAHGVGVVPRHYFGASLWGPLLEQQLILTRRRCEVGGVGVDSVE